MHLPERYLGGKWAGLGERLKERELLRRTHLPICRFEPLGEQLSFERGAAQRQKERCVSGAEGVAAWQNCELTENSG